MDHDDRLLTITRSPTSSASLWRPCAGGGTSRSDPTASRSGATSGTACQTCTLGSISSTDNGRPDRHPAETAEATYGKHRKAR